MTNDREIYIASGMNDCLGKPFTSQELWRCLMKFFKPLNWQKEDAAKLEQVNNIIQQKKINNFVRENRGKLKEIMDAINIGDITLAHRLVHTLKSNAGQLNKTILQQIAEEIESCLKDGENKVTLNQLETLEIELNAVLATLTPLVSEITLTEAAEKKSDNAATRELLDKVELLLDVGDIECLSFINELQLIPENSELIQSLIQQLDILDFTEAKKTLVELKKRV